VRYDSEGKKLTSYSETKIEDLKFESRDIKVNNSPIDQNDYHRNEKTIKCGDFNSGGSETQQHWGIKMAEVFRRKWMGEFILITSGYNLELWEFFSIVILSK